MTAMFLIAATFVVSSAGMLDLRRDARRERDRLEVERITAPLPAALKDLTGEWPRRESPTDLAKAYDRPALYHSQPVPAMRWLTTDYLTPRGCTPWPVIQARLVRERALETPTAAFNTLVAATWTEDERQSLSTQWWCTSCAGLADFGRPHEICEGECACPCTTAEVAA